MGKWRKFMGQQPLRKGSFGLRVEVLKPTLVVTVNPQEALVDRLKRFKYHPNPGYLIDAYDELRHTRGRSYDVTLGFVRVFCPPAVEMTRHPKDVEGVLGGGVVSILELLSITARDVKKLGFAGRVLFSPWVKIFAGEPCFHGIAFWGEFSALYTYHHMHEIGDQGIIPVILDDGL